MERSTLGEARDSNGAELAALYLIAIMQVKYLYVRLKLSSSDIAFPVLTLIAILVDLLCRPAG